MRFTIIERVSIPALHIDSVLRRYVRAAGSVSTVVVFSPLRLAVKIFLLLGFTCIAAWITLLAAFRMQPVPAE